MPILLFAGYHEAWEICHVFFAFEKLPFGRKSFAFQNRPTNVCPWFEQCSMEKDRVVAAWRRIGLLLRCILERLTELVWILVFQYHIITTSAMNTRTVASPRRIDDILVRIDNEHRAGANEILHACLTSTGILTWNPRTWRNCLSWKEHYWNRHCRFVTICNSTVWLVYPETKRSRCVTKRFGWTWHW